jgi:hypothetical protein
MPRMAKTIYGMDVDQTLVAHEFRILVLEGVLDLVMARIPTAAPVVKTEEISDIRRRAIDKLNAKYPQARLSYSKSESD